MSDPRREAFSILRRVEEAGAYASILLESRARSLSDPRDAALLTELVLGVLRRRAVLDHAIAAVASRPVEATDPAVRTALRIGAYSLLFLDRVPAFAAVDTSVDLARRAGARAAAAFVNAVLRGVARDGRSLLPSAPVEGDVESLALHHSHPAWWTRRLVERFGWEKAAGILERNNEPAPTVLASADPSARERLEREGIVLEPGRYVPGALRVVSGLPQATRAFREGGMWVQDEASQLVPLLFADPVGPRVADLCAAPGGKTLALAARVPAGGFVLAADRSERRVRRLRDNVVRVGASSVQPVAADLSSDPPAIVGPFDDVLLDAPCTGTGTLRRHPEIRWRLAPEQIARLAAGQERLLDRASRLVRPGGRLVYSVCSIEPEEGPAVASRFLASHPDFAAGDPSGALPVPARALVGEDRALSSATAPGADGFFAALFLRRASV